MEVEVVLGSISSSDPPAAPWESPYHGSCRSLEVDANHNGGDLGAVLFLARQSTVALGVAASGSRGRREGLRGKSAAGAEDAGAGDDLLRARLSKAQGRRRRKGAVREGERRRWLSRGVASP